MLGESSLKALLSSVFAIVRRYMTRSACGAVIIKAHRPSFDRKRNDSEYSDGEIETSVDSIAIS